MSMSTTQPKALSRSDGSTTVPAGSKRTDLGVIPAEWDTRTLGEIGQCLIGLTYDPSNVTSDGLLVLRSSNIGDGVLRFYDNVFVDIVVSERLIVHESDLLICVRNGSRPLIGKCALIDRQAEGMTFGAFMSVFRSPHNRFVFYCFQSDIVKRQIHEHLGATINQITNRSLKSFRVPFPDSPERRAITRALSEVDGLIGVLDKMIAKKQAIKLAAMQQLLTGKTRLPGFSEEWRFCTLGDLGSFSKGRGIKRDDISDDGVACIRYGELYTRYHDYIITPVSRISPQVALTAQPIRTGDLLFAGSGETAEEIGRCVAYIGEEEAYAGGDIIVLTPTGQDSLYLGHLMNQETIAAQKARFGQGDAVVHISSRNLAQVEIELPLVEEQTAIATVIFDMDAEIAALVLRRNKTKQIKQGMMQELLTGRIRLAKSEEPAVATAAAPKATKAHNWQINEAVVISVLAKQFGSEQYPLGRRRYTKLSYLLHRHAEHQAEGYRKQAAGPYNPKTKYGGPEDIAVKNGYVREHTSGMFLGFIAGDNIDQADGYFNKWYASETRQWLEQFRYKKNNELELLTTVDMAVEELRTFNTKVSVDAVKKVIRSNKEWKVKLDRPIFSDTNIGRAIEDCSTLLDSNDGGPSA